jgi:hypothetical protein
MKQPEYTFEIPAGQITVRGHSATFADGEAVLTIDEVEVQAEFSLELDDRNRWRVAYLRVFPKGFELLWYFTRDADGKIGSDPELANAELAKANEAVRLGVPKAVAADARSIIEVAVSNWISTHPLEMQSMAGRGMRHDSSFDRQAFREAAAGLRDGVLGPARAFPGEPERPGRRAQRRRVSKAVQVA